MVAALKDLIGLMLPIVGGQMLNSMADRWTVALVGQWDYQIRAHYVAAGIGKMYSNVTGLSLGDAALLGLGTFAAQAHGACTSHQVSALYVRRALFLLTLLFSLPLLAALFSESVLLAMRMPADVARCSAAFVRLQLLGLPFYWASSAARMALNGAKKTSPGFKGHICSAVAQIIVSIVLMHPRLCNLGYLGAALARSIGGVVSLLTIAVCVKAGGLEYLVWRMPPNSEHIVKWSSLWAFLKVSLPSASIVWLEWWAFEFLAALVGWTPAAGREVNLAAHGAMFSCISILYRVWFGASNAMGILVSKHIGADRQDELPSLLRAASLLSVATSAVVAAGYEIWKCPLARAFTKDIVVQQALVENSLGLVLSVPPFAQLMTFSGALRGANRQRPAIIATVVGYWVIGLPAGGALGCVLGWPTPLTGVWLGNAIALFVAAAWVCITVFVRIDWHSIRRLSEIEEALVLPQAQNETCPGAAEDLAAAS